jgi:thioredoxin-like negative regulator of GroEL
VLLAESLTGGGDLDGAIGVLRGLAEEAPSATDVRVRLSLNLLARAEADRAAAPAGRPPAAAAAAAAAAASALAESHGHLTASIAAEPSLVEARVALGRVLQLQGRALEAAGELREAGTPTRTRIMSHRHWPSDCLVRVWAYGLGLRL